MNIKGRINFIRSILYLQEVIKYKSLSKAAAENNIKPSNLSTMMSNLEKEVGMRLLKRSPQGCVATPQGQKIAHCAATVQEIVTKIMVKPDKTSSGRHTLSVYLSPYLTLNDYQNFEYQHPQITLNFVEDENLADVSISNLPPSNKKTSYAELLLGKEVQQKIWVCCNEQNKIALEFFDFIVEQLLLLYAQSEP